MAPNDPVRNDYRICQTAKRDYYVRDERLIERVAAPLRNNHYCTVLGPRYCHKTQLLKDVREVLEGPSKACVCVDFKALSSEHREPRRILEAFAGMVADQLHCTPPGPLPDPRAAVGVLQLYLRGCVSALKRDVVLLLNRLELIPMAALHPLLEALRAVFDEAREQDDQYRLAVATASALHVAELALGPSSPFNIAHLVWMEDLEEGQSRLLVRHIADQGNVAIPPDATDRLLEAAHGDRYLIPKLCARCVEVAAVAARPVTVADVNDAVKWFLDSQTSGYPPLEETVAALERSPFALLDCLDVLKQRRAPRNQLRIESQYGALRLSGAVREEEETVYCIRNEIYEAYLRKQLFPSHVVDVLQASGRREEAIAYLEGLVLDQPELRGRYLNAMIDGIYAAADEASAYSHLVRHLGKAFEATRTRAYALDGAAHVLRQVAQDGYDDSLAWDPPLDEGFPECEAARTKQVINTGSIIAVPLSDRAGKVFGVAALRDLHLSHEESRYQELTDFLLRAGWAIAHVATRQRNLLAIEGVYQSWSRATTSLDLDEVLASTVDAAMRAVPAADAGAVFLWDRERQKLVIRAHRMFPVDVAADAQLARGQGYVGWVYENRMPVLLADVGADKRHVPVGTLREQSAICVPLEAWMQPVGAFCLLSQKKRGAFQRRDLELLGFFAGAAGLAIQNARFVAELLDLVPRINKPGLGAENIFRAVAQSITRVCNATAVNMLLFRDTGALALRLSEAPQVVVSEGLPREFDEVIRPRPDGLTAKVLQTGRPQFVENPDAPTGINPIAAQHGTRAYICLPLKVDQGVIGVLFVHYGEPHEFSNHEVGKLELFANQTALAIRNARQRDLLDLVVWMGIGFSALFHEINSKASAIIYAQYALSEKLANRPDLQCHIDRIENAAEAILRIEKELPRDESTELILLNDFLREEVPKWCVDTCSFAPDFNVLATNGVTVAADRHRLALVIQILTSNAVRAMQGTPTRRLTVDGRLLGEFAEVRITNTGEPIPAGIQSLLFTKPIKRSSGAGGTGIGLLIAKAIFVKYGGDVKLEKSDAHGTTFVFSLPVSRAAREGGR